MVWRGGAYLLAFEVGVLDDAHDGGKAHGSLVDGLQKVCGDHDDQDPLVDEFAESAVFLLGYLECFVGYILGEFLVDFVVPLTVGLEVVEVCGRCTLDFVVVSLDWCIVVGDNVVIGVLP